MLDANEQAKGGFGAFAAREQERVDALPPVSTEDGQADGARPDAEPPASETPAPPAPTGRQPKRWH